MKNAYIYIYATVFFILTSMAGLHAQEQESLSYFVQANSIATDGSNAPFWLTAQRSGISTVNSNSGYARYGISYKGSFGKENRFKYNATADIVTGYNQQNTFMLQQAFFDLNWKWLTLSIGSKERWSEREYMHTIQACAAFENSIVNEYPNLFAGRYASLGSGGLTFSGNSRPIPQIRAEIQDYIDFPWTNGWLQIRGHIAYGMFTDHNFQEDFTRNNPKAHYARNILYHSKAMFLKIGKSDRFPLTIEGGLEMYTQFGGDIYTHEEGLKISMPRKPMDFFKALIPMGGNEDTPTVEQTNISGNQVGSWHAALTWHTKKTDIRIYGEHLFEDFSQLFFFEYQQNRKGEKRIIYYPWRDFLVGINIRNKSRFLPFVDNFRYEYLTTRDQSGALYHDPSDHFSEQMDGCDNYYNHGIYPGWHHWGMGIGNPLVVSPAYNSNGSLQFGSNRLIAHNIGLNGVIECSLPIAYRLNYTYSENWGTYINPFDRKKYTTSLLAEVTFAPRKSNWAATLSLGHDKSNHIGDNTGIMLTLSHCGILFNK